MKLAVAAVVSLGLAAPAGTVVSFDDQRAGEVPRGMSCATTGNGRPGVWTILADATAPTPPNVLAQTDDDSTGYRFPVCVLDAISLADVDLSIRFKSVKGAVDQAVGLVWRYRDKDNYYLLRANALENNLVLYKVEAGKRSALKPRGAGMFAYGREARVPSGAWGALRVVVKGALFAGYLNGEKLFDVEDGTFADAGRVGVWTKADSVTYFDDLRIAPAAR
ncbi:MAG: hypothetical protein JNM38_26070 [Acidobacteria bacterium]|nr:hypothetical protein [Acidobacteriota bacterium]